MAHHPGPTDVDEAEHVHFLIAQRCSVGMYIEYLWNIGVGMCTIQMHLCINIYIYILYIFTSSYIYIIIQYT